MRRKEWNPVMLMALLGLLGLTPVWAWGQVPAPNPGDYVQPFERQGEVNWTSGFIVAKGIGVASTTAVNEGQRRAQALHAAEVLARRNLLAIIKGVNLDSQTNVENAMLVSDMVAQRVNGFLQGTVVVDTKVLPDGSAEVTLAVRATGPLAEIVLPLQRPPRPTPPPPTTPPPPQPGPTTTTAPPPPPPTPEIFTGLVIDARGLNVRPAITPKFLSEAGQEIYGSAVVDREWAIREGMAGYAKDLSAAQSNDRVGRRPLVAKAVRTAGANKADVVLSNADAAKLLAAAENLSFLEKARVMIVVD